MFLLFLSSTQVVTRVAPNHFFGSYALSARMGSSIDHLWRRGGVGSLTPPARGPTAGAQTFWRHWLLCLLSSTLVLESWVPVLGWVFLAHFPAQPQKTRNHNTDKNALSAPPAYPAGTLVVWWPFPFLVVRWPFPFLSVERQHKAPFLGPCVTNPPYSFSLDPERTHNTKHTVPYLCIYTPDDPI